MGRKIGFWPYLELPSSLFEWKLAGWLVAVLVVLVIAAKIF